MKPETVLKHATVFYEELAKTSRNGVFTGSLTKVFTNVCELPVSYYSPVKQMLDELGCLQIIERGTRKNPSVVKLLKSPPSGDADLPESIVKSLEQPLTDRETVARLVEQVESLEAWRESQRGIVLVEALRNIERRLHALENPEI